MVAKLDESGLEGHVWIWDLKSGCQGAYGCPKANRVWQNAKWVCEKAKWVYLRKSQVGL